MRRKSGAVPKKPVTNPLYGEFDAMVDAVISSDKNHHGTYSCEQCGHVWVHGKSKKGAPVCPKCKSIDIDVDINIDLASTDNT